MKIVHTLVAAMVFIGITSLGEPTVNKIAEAYTHAKYRVLANLEEFDE